MALLEVRSLEELRGLLGALAELEGRVARHAGAARQSVDVRFNQLERRGRELERAVEEAGSALTRLGEEDDPGDAHERLGRASHDLRRFEEVRRECASIRRRFDARLDELVERSGMLCGQASRELTETLARAAAYVALVPDGADQHLSTQASLRRSAQASAMVDGALARLRAAKLDASTAGLPEGFAWIELTQLADNSFVQDPAQFRKGTTKAQMEDGIRRLRSEILPVLERNPRVGRDFFERLDDERGTAYTPEGFVHPESLAELWTYFFDQNHHAIRVDNVDEQGRLEVGNGRHRLGVAREMGVPSMPAWFQVR